MSPAEVLFRPLEQRVELAELIAVQRLYMSLLYCEDTNREYESDPVAVLRRFGLGEGARSMLPDVTSRKHKAERHGRRILAANELANEIPRTLSVALGGEAPNIPRIAGAPFFVRYLSSQEFLGKGGRLPHRLGIGPGYENVSAFFFWGRRDLVPSCPAAREPLFEEFGRWLVRNANHSREPLLDRFRRGVFFVRASGAAAVVTPKQVVDVTDDANVAAALRARGFSDMDELRA